MSGWRGWYRRLICGQSASGRLAGRAVLAHVGDGGAPQMSLGVELLERGLPGSVDVDRLDEAARWKLLS